MSVLSGLPVVPTAGRESPFSFSLAPQLAFPTASRLTAARTPPIKPAAPPRRMAGRALSFQPAAAHQIDRKTAQPVAAFVMFALDAVEPRLTQPARQRSQWLAAGGPGRRRPAKHP